MTTNELAIPEATSTITPAQFDQAINEATLKAAKLKEIVEQANLYVTMGAGKKYLMVEAWQTIGVAYGLTARIDWSRQFADRAGWEARATVIRTDGIEVAAAEAECGSTGDAPWNKRPEYQQRSMAQTRAISKALRSCLSWVVVLAGYEATPSDEMPETTTSVTASEVSTDGPNTATINDQDARAITQAQRTRLFAIIKGVGVDEALVKDYMVATFNVHATADLNRTQYDHLISWIEEQDADG